MFELKTQTHTRAAFLTRATLATGAVLGTGAVTPFVRTALAQTSTGDADIVNFALTLEYLEAAFYASALKEVSGLSGDVKMLATELRDNEQAHVDALKQTVKSIGGMAVGAPKVDFGQAFASEAAFLKAANTFEDLGVSAYNGAAPMIESKEILSAAGGIAQVEGRHAALIRLARGKPPSPLAFDPPATKEDVLAAAQPFLA